MCVCVRHAVCIAISVFLCFSVQYSSLRVCVCVCVCAFMYDCTVSFCACVCVCVFMGE